MGKYVRVYERIERENQRKVERHCCCCCEHFATIALEGGGGRVGVAKLVRHRGVREEGEAGMAKGGNEGRGTAWLVTWKAPQWQQTYGRRGVRE